MMREHWYREDDTLVNANDPPMPRGSPYHPYVHRLAQMFDLPPHVVEEDWTPTDVLDTYESRRWLDDVDRPPEVPMPGD